MAWQYDPNLSKVEWAVSYLGIATIKGRFTKVQASLDFEDTDPTRWSFEATIDVASLFSGHDAMDDHVRTPDFLDAAGYPTITFKSKRVEAANGKYRVTGDLTLHGTTKEVVLDGGYGGEATDSRGRTKRGFSGELKLKRSDFGIPTTSVGNLSVAADDVHVTLNVVANKAD